MKAPKFIVFAILIIVVLVSSSIVYVPTEAITIQNEAITNESPIQIREMAEHQNTTVIDVETEGSGDIINEVEGSTNLNGAMVWNGTGWVVNPTWAHKFFLDTRTGNRLKSYTSLDVTVSGLPAGETEEHADGYGKYCSAESFGNYSITKQTYWYTKPVATGKGSGSYQYGAVEYRITDSTKGLQVILRSQGVGEGKTKAYFDVYIDDETTNSFVQTTAFIGDPVWYTFPVKASSALGITDLSAYRTGSLPGAVTKQSSNNGDYYLDIGGGADLGPAGVGKSYELHTEPLRSKFSNLSPSYITGFELKYMDSTGNLQKIVVNPTLFSEKYNPLTTSALPTQTISPSPTVPEFPSIAMFLLLVALSSTAVLLFKLRNKNHNNAERIHQFV